MIRLLGLILVAWTVLDSKHAPVLHGRGVVVLICAVIALLGWLTWALWSTRQGRREVTIDLFVLAAAGGVMCGAAPDTAASACMFVAVVSAAVRVGLSRALPVVMVGILALAVADLIYDNSALGLLAYSLGLIAAGLGGSNVRQTLVRADDAELLLAQSQRSHEEQLRAAKLEESARIARDIHDVLAHTLAGLAIQLEATEALLAQGADPDSVRSRVHRAHELALAGLAETRRAVGALRTAPGSASSLPLGDRLRQLIADYREGSGAVTLVLDGNLEGIDADAAEAAFRMVQEALTNVRKHASDAAVTVSLRVDDDLFVVVENERSETGAHPDTGELGGGYGLRGMKERAELLGGTLEAGLHDGGWRVELRLPAAAASAPDREPA